MDNAETNKQIEALITSFQVILPEQWDSAKLVYEYDGSYKIKKYYYLNGAEHDITGKGNPDVAVQGAALRRSMKEAGRPWIKFTLTLESSGVYHTDFEEGEPDMSPPNLEGHASGTILQQGYEARDNIWKKVGRLDDYVLAHLMNPALQGMPEWPDLRQSYKVVHLGNGHTIIATDGLSDPFMKDHQFYKPNVNGFGLELYIEITEPFDEGKAGYTWWYNLLYQEALQVAYSGDLLTKLNEYDGVLSTELYDVHELPDKFKNEGRAPILLGAPSNIVPNEIKGPLSSIRFVSIELLTLDELEYVLDKGEDGRSDIARELVKRYGTAISALDRQSVVSVSEIQGETVREAQKDNQVPEEIATAADTGSVPRRIDLIVKQSWLEKSSETALEEFKSVFASVLNNFPEDRHVDTDRWTITKVTEGDVAHLLYDERSIATLKIENSALHIVSQSNNLARYDDIMYAIRYAANRLVLAVFSNVHGGARLPQEYTLSLDHTYFERDKALANFFAHCKFVPRFAPEGIKYLGDDRQALVIYSPYYAENKEDGSIHILNNPMLSFLSEKDNQKINGEFSYKVANSMQDFARKYDLGLVPSSFYQNYGFSTKIINETYFDINHINRKVFVDPYVWDFDDEHDYRFYKNVKNGMHLMDKVRKGENLDQALRRVLREELQVADNYVGARVWGIEFDRDRDDILTPRLKINIFVNGMAQKHRSQSHDWVSVK